MAYAPGVRAPLSRQVAGAKAPQSHPRRGVVCHARSGMAQRRRASSDPHYLKGGPPIQVTSEYRLPEIIGNTRWYSNAGNTTTLPCARA